MSTDTLPKISVVIPSFNQGQYIEQTITSVLGQNYPNLELIVIDGGSTDNTHEVVQKYIRSISFYVSEPDNGQAHAINKGFRVAQGDIFAWLNSDDMYLPCTLLKVATAFQDLEELSFLYGGCLHFKERSERTFGYLPPTFDADRLRYFDYIVQPSTFWSRTLWEKVGELDESYHYVLDWDWFIRASEICTFTPLHDYLSIYRLHEAHKTGTGGSARGKEILQIVENYADEKWIALYRELHELAPSMRKKLGMLARFRLYRLRQLFFPYLYFRFGNQCIEMALTML